MATVDQPVDAAVGPPKERVSSLRRDTMRNILGQRSAVAGLIILGILVLVAIFAPFIAPHDPLVSMLDEGETGIKRGQPPCIHLLGCPADQPQHIMGLDSNLRDEFSRVVFGARVSLQVGIITVGFAILVGTTLGAIAGFAGGRTDNVTMRSLDIVLAFPSLILAIAIVTVLGSGLFQAQIAIAIVSIPIYARVMRGSVLATREQEFVTASRALGESSRGILSRRILPNSMTPAHRAGDARDRRGHPRGGGPLVPGPRGAAAAGRMGLDDRLRSQPVLLGSAPHLLPRASRSP